MYNRLVSHYFVSFDVCTVTYVDDLFTCIIWIVYFALYFADKASRLHLLIFYNSLVFVPNHFNGEFIDVASIIFVTSMCLSVRRQASCT